MSDLRVWAYRFANARVWAANRRSRFWGEIAYHIWHRLSLAEQRKAMNVKVPF